MNCASLGAGERRDDSPEYTIFVGDSAADVTDYVLQETFKPVYSSVKGAKVVPDRIIGRTKGYRFVKFANESKQLRAMTEMNGVLCSSRPIRIGPAANKKPIGTPRKVLEKLCKARWGPEDVVGCIIMSPTRELAGQLFEVLKSVGKHHGFSVGLLIGDRKDVDAEKEDVNVLNILVCPPGRPLQHMDETPNFDCSHLQVLEKLCKARWGPEDGVGCIIMSPTRELAGQLFEVLKSVGKHHGFSAGLLIGGRKYVGAEKEHVNVLNILVCTPGRPLQHMDETPNFDCSQFQVLVLDEADRILDVGFKRELNAIISQLPKHRQTLLFSATQTKSVQKIWQGSV